jgi:WD40 repeat protein
MSGSFDETTRVRDVKKGETILGPIRRHQWVLPVMDSPDNTKFAIGGHNENEVKIWDAKMGELVATLEHHHIVCSLAWTSDGKKAYFVRITLTQPL